MDMGYLRRRAFLSSAIPASVCFAAGCTTNSNNSQTPSRSEEYSHLAGKYVYTGERVSLTVPKNINTTTDIDESDIVVLSDSPNKSPQEVVGWLSDGKIVVLYGENAQKTWLSWVNSNAYNQTFSQGAYQKNIPKPSVLAAAVTDNPFPTTFRTSWPEEPHSRDVFSWLDSNVCYMKRGNTPSCR